MSISLNERLVEEISFFTTIFAVSIIIVARIAKNRILFTTVLKLTARILSMHE